MNAELLQRKSFIITLGLLTTVAALTIDMSLPAIPAMVDALATTMPKGQKIVGVFIFGMALGQVPWGLASDRLGRLPVMYTGMTLFAIAATAAAFARNVELMLLARFVQGFGASSAIVLSRAVVRDVATGKDAARLMSLMTMLFTAAPVIAPTLGALLVARWGWRAPFTVIAGCGIVLLFAIRRNLVETHVPAVNVHPVRQLASSVREFFSYRQSIFGLLLIILPPAGFLSVIAVSSALAVETYGFSVQAYGLIFACAGISILAGSAINRWLVGHLDQVQLLGLAVGLMGAASAQLAIIAWLDAAPFWWLWTCVCLFMFAVPFLFANASVVALDPLARVAGVASSIIGTLQNLVGGTGAMLGASLYDGSVRNAILLMAIVGLATTTVFLLRPLIAPGDLVHHADEPARD